MSYPYHQLLSLVGPKLVSKQWVVHIHSLITFRFSSIYSQLSVNLVSVSKLIRSLNCSITSNNNSVVIEDRDTGRMIGAGHELQGLYHLTLPPYSVACTISESPLLLRNRLGHPSLLKLQKMVPSLSTLSSLSCESCEFGKHSHSSFPKCVNNRAVSPFELVHSDVCGPCHVSSTLGFQYFVKFSDDYSRCTFLFLMKGRSELFFIFESFCAEIKTQFNLLFDGCEVIMLVNTSRSFN